jgi:hypothetical protein
MNARLLIAVCLWFSAGCVRFIAQPLSELPINVQARLEPCQRGSSRFVVLPFEDRRGVEFARVDVSAQAPPISLVQYDGDVRSRRDAGVSIIWVGGLHEAVGSLLARTLAKMEGGDAVACRPAASTAELSPGDLVIGGELRRSRFRLADSPLTCIALGLFGVPCERSEYELEYQVTVYRAPDLGRPIFSKPYRFTESGVGGLYRPAPSLYRLMLDGFEQTLPETARDIALVAARAAAPPS